jgi:50S ribosomal subunit-associated GTPase HflX
VLAEIGAEEIPQILVLNKIDRLADRDFESLGRRLVGEVREHHSATRAVPVSAISGDGLPQLITAIDELLPFDPLIRTHLTFPLAEAGARLALLHELGRVLETRYEEDSCIVEAEIPESARRLVE